MTASAATNSFLTGMPRFLSQNSPLSPASLSAVLLSAAVTSFVAFASIPRRPDVFLDGNIIDQQYTVSLLRRYSFSWATPLLVLAKTRALDLSDLPQLDHHTRSRNLSARLPTDNCERRLWRLLVTAHARTLVHQWTLILLKSVFGFTTPFVLHRFLQRLERAPNASGTDGQAWAWVLALGFSLLMEVLVDGWLKWVTESRLELPLQAQLQSLVFQKAMRRQIVHDTEPAANGKGISEKSGKFKKVAPQAGQPQGRRSVINLFKSDRQVTLSMSVLIHADLEQHPSCQVLYLWSLLPNGSVQDPVECDFPDPTDRIEKRSHRICGIHHIHSYPQESR